MEGVTFALQAGDGLGIIGPSGGGKSTLIRGMLGVIPPVSGEVRFDGAPLDLSLIHISEPTRQESRSRMPSSA